MSLVLTSQKEPLGISKKGKQKVEEAKCGASGHVSLCRVCARELLLTRSFCIIARMKLTSCIPFCIQYCQFALLKS